MIYQLSGNVCLIRDEFIVIDVRGVGFGVTVPASFKSSLTTGQSIQLFTWCHYREDAQDLYGFQTETDRQMFSLLTSVSGVGPKLAIKIMSEYPTASLIKILLSGDLARLTAISGVGKKVGERLILELKDKTTKMSTGISLDLSEIHTASSPTLDPNLANDLRMALSALGYHSDEIKRALKAAATELVSCSDLESAIKIILKQF